MNNKFCINKKLLFITLLLTGLVFIFFLIYRINNTFLTKSSEAAYIPCIKIGNKVSNYKKCCGGSGTKMCMGKVYGGGAYLLDCSTGKTKEFKNYNSCTSSLKKKSIGAKMEWNNNAIPETPKPIDGKTSCNQTGNNCFVTKCEDVKDPYYRWIDVSNKFYCDYNWYCCKSQPIIQPTPIPPIAEITHENVGNGITLIKIKRGDKNYSISIKNKINNPDHECETILNFNSIPAKGIIFPYSDVSLIPSYSNSQLEIKIFDILRNQNVYTLSYGESPMWAVYYNSVWQCIEK